MHSSLLLFSAATITVILGLIVLFQHNRKTENVHFALLSFGIAGWIISNALFRSVVEDEVRFAIGLISYGCAAFLVLNFFLFCLDISGKQYSQAIRFWAKLIGALTIFFSMIPGVVAYGVDGLSMETNTSGLLLYALLLVLPLGGGLWILLRSIRSTSSQLQRNRIISVLSGLSVAVAVGIVCNLIFPLFNNYSLVQYGPLGSVLLVAVCAYSIVRYGLFDVKLAAVRSVVYTFSLFTLAAIYYLLAYVISTVIFNQDAVMGTVVSPISIVLALVLAFSFQPVKHFFDRATDEVFYKNRYDTGEFLIRVGRILTSTTELHDILDKVGKEIRQTLKASGSLFLVFRDDSPKELVGGGIKNDFTDEELAALSAASSSSEGSLLIASKLSSSSLQNDKELYKVLSKRRIALVLPLVSTDETIGYFMLGERMAGSYSQQDIDALDATANELVIAVQNARSVQAVRDINAHLEQRIEAATSELLSSNEKLRRLDAAKDEFVSMASHQLRTPLTSVKGYISMVLEGDAGKITPMQKQLLGEAFTSSERMVHLISDFLNVSRLQTGKFVLDQSFINLADLVEEEVAGLRATAKARSLKLEYRKSLGIPSLYIDSGKIHQVIMNFIDNAIYYSPEDNVITVKLSLDGGYVMFTVQDTGIGVPKSEQAQLFTKFFRATNAKRQRPDGTGIGLYLAKKVIDAHDGTMVFESRIGKGSTFGFRLPIKKLSLAPSEK